MLFAGSSATREPVAAVVAGLGLPGVMASGERLIARSARRGRCGAVTAAIVQTSSPRAGVCRARGKR